MDNYKEALEKAKSALANTESAVTAGILRDIFPELKESEDERIRKEITELVMQPSWKTEKEFYRRKELCAWLEKQGEQKQVEVRPFNKVFSQEQIDEIDKRIETEMKLYNAKLMDAQMRAKDFPMTD